MATVSAAAVSRAQPLRQPQGLLKAVVEVGTKRILGCSLLCAEAGKVINTVQLAINTRSLYPVLRDNIHIHPSITEAFNELFGKLWSSLHY